MRRALKHEAAEGKHRRRIRYHRPVRLFVGAVAVLAAGAPVAGPAMETVVAHADSRTPRTDGPTDQLPWKGIPAREVLRRLVGALVVTPPGVGRFTYVYMRRWPADPAFGAGPAATEDEKVWRAANGSGSRSTAVVAAGGTDSRAVTQPEQHAITFSPGDLPVVLGALSAKPEILAGQLNYYGGQLGLSLPEMIGIMNTQTCLTSQQRAAVLQVLADTDGLVFLGRVDDRNGRPGVALALTGTDSQGVTVRDILIFDEAAGALLSYERQFAEVFTKSAHHPAAVMSYVLYLRCGQTDALGQEP